MSDFTKSVLSALYVRQPDREPPDSVLEFTVAAREEDQIFSEEDLVDVCQFLTADHREKSSPVAAKAICETALGSTWFSSMGASAVGELDHAMHHLATGQGWTVDGQEWCNPATPETLCSMVGYWSAVYRERKNSGDVDEAAKALTKWGTAYVLLLLASPSTLMSKRKDGAGY